MESPAPAVNVIADAPPAAITATDSSTNHNDSPFFRLDENGVHPTSVSDEKILKRKRENASSGRNITRCSCTRSQCLKLYCECFRSSLYCTESCGCQGCFNRPEQEDTVEEVRYLIEQRDPTAFVSRIRPDAGDSSTDNGEDANPLATSAPRHKKGCHCKKSMCQKKYCECYQAGVSCSEECTCLGCQNKYGRKEESAAEEMLNQTNGGTLEGICDKEPEAVDSKEAFSEADLHVQQHLTLRTSSRQGSDHSNYASTSQLNSKGNLPSLQSDFTASVYASSILAQSVGNGMPLLANIDQADAGFGGANAHSAEQTMQFSRSYNVPCSTSHPSPFSQDTAANSSWTVPGTSSWSYASRIQWCPVGNFQEYSRASSVWPSSSDTQVTRLGGTRFLQGYESEEAVVDIDMPVSSVRLRSPSKNQGSPPRRSLLPELGSGSLAGLEQ